MNINFRSLDERDIDALTPIMTRAFDHDAMVNTGEPTGGPQGYDDGSFLRKYGLHRDTTSYCIEIDGRLAGAAILWIRADHENRLGCLFLDPDLIGRGIGTRIWQRIEQMYPDTRTWGTDTVLSSRSNLVYYVNKCGFHIVHIDFADGLPQGSVSLRKMMG